MNVRNMSQFIYATFGDIKPLLNGDDNKYDMARDLLVAYPDVFENPIEESDAEKLGSLFKGMIDAGYSPIESFQFGLAALNSDADLSILKEVAKVGYGLNELNSLLNFSNFAIVYCNQNPSGALSLAKNALDIYGSEALDAQPLGVYTDIIDLIETGALEKVLQLSQEMQDKYELPFKSANQVAEQVYHDSGIKGIEEMNEDFNSKGPGFLDIGMINSEKNLFESRK